MLAIKRGLAGERWLAVKRWLATRAVVPSLPRYHLRGECMTDGKRGR